MKWFEVDREGLGKILDGRGRETALLELVQNAWDEDVTKVEVELEPVPNSPSVEVSVTDDDPEGFDDLRHAWTLFAESAKKDDPEKRGRFNLGEKLVLALCREARIETVSGTVFFKPDKGRTTGPSRRDQGSKFWGIVRMTRDELEEARTKLRSLVPPDDVDTFVDGEKIPSREQVASIEVTLPTEKADEEGRLRRTSRKTQIDVYEPRSGEEATLYEMGIPVVETGDRWHVDVQQKIPLTMDRANVSPAFLRKVRCAVLNEASDLLDKEDASENWITEAMEDDAVTPDAVRNVLDNRFGKKRVSYDPSDPEANKRAVAEGYTVIHGSELSGDAWENVKRHGGVRPAGTVTPSPSPYDPNAEKTAKVYSPDDWTPGMEEVHEYVSQISEEILTRIEGVRTSIDVRFVLAGFNFSACYGCRTMDFNVRTLGWDWFDEVSRKELNELVIHELGHEYSGDHLSSDFHDALCEVGSVLGEIALANPELMSFR